MEIRQHEWLSASPHEGFEQMRLKSRPKEPSPSLTRVGANFYSSVKQQDYSASVWLRRKDKLEHDEVLPWKLAVLTSQPSTLLQYYEVCGVCLGSTLKPHLGSAWEVYPLL
ncbi:inactive phospholipase D5 [Pteropus alecto]|uniref:inactive phospholipase D5 n=1 Tax=Pteropus alecto TaxID=9402 RepID=UPI000768992B|nr:inactive phospholipase D5 [Pteropus alecto]